MSKPGNPAGLVGELLDAAAGLTARWRGRRGWAGGARRWQLSGVTTPAVAVGWPVAIFGTDAKMGAGPGSLGGGCWVVGFTPLVHCREISCFGPVFGPKPEISRQ